MSKMSNFPIIFLFKNCDFSHTFATLLYLVYKQKRWMEKLSLFFLFAYKIIFLRSLPFPSHGATVIYCSRIVISNPILCGYLVKLISKPGMPETQQDTIMLKALLSYNILIVCISMPDSNFFVVTSYNLHCERLILFVRPVTRRS